MNSGTATAARLQPQDKLAVSFGKAVRRLSTASLPLLEIPAVFVSEFGAARGELWITDNRSGSTYLVHAAGVEASHPRDHVSRGEGLISKALETRARLTLALAKTPGYREFAQRSGLTHATLLPLQVNDKLLGVSVVYTRARAKAESLRWWELCADVAAEVVLRALAADQDHIAITQLSLLFEATRLLNSTLDLVELLELILKIAREEVHADRGSVFLVDSERQQLWSIVAMGLEHEEIRLPFGTGVAGTVASTGTPINVEDAYTLPFFDRSFDQKFNYQTKSLLCMPIRRRDGQIVGVIQLLNQKVSGRFTDEDQDFLEKLSGHMAMALENARLHREALEKQRMERELEMARGIQRSLLPDAPPIVPGYDLAVFNHPCFEVGGDYFDFLSLGPQTLLLVIADVEGKGVSSALVMSNLQATLRALVTHLHSLEVLALSLNEMIYNDTKSKKFLSIFLGLLDTRRNGLHYINAGHVPPVIVRGETGKYQTLEAGGTVVGLFPDSEYSRGAYKLNPGDVLVLCTDGITEPCDVTEEEYGSDRLGQCVSRNRHKSAHEIIDAVLEEVSTFSRGGVHVDDKVLMVVKVTAGGADSATSPALAHR